MADHCATNVKSRGLSTISIFLGEGKIRLKVIQIIIIFIFMPVVVDFAHIKGTYNSTNTNTNTNGTNTYFTNTLGF